MSTLSDQAELLHAILGPVEDALGRLHVLVPACADVAERSATFGAGTRATAQLHTKVEEVTARVERVRIDIDDAMRLVETMQSGEGYELGMSPGAISTSADALDGNLETVLEQVVQVRVSIEEASRDSGPVYLQAEQVLQGAIEYAGGQLAELAQLLVDTAERIAAELHAAKGELEDTTRIAADASDTGDSLSPGPLPLEAKVLRAPSQARIRELAAALPPPVVRRSGQKTHGRYVDHSDPDASAKSLVSGSDELSEETWTVLQRLGLAQRGRPFVVDHVEVKAAIRMACDGATEATLVINNSICPGRFNCTYYGERILYEGTTLQVQTPSYRVLLRGRRKRDDST